jgi:hypothetical protein
VTYQQTSSANISDCSFLECSVTDPGCQSGACYLQINSLTMTRCFAHTCYCDSWGQFLCLYGPSVSGALTESLAFNYAPPGCQVAGLGSITVDTAITFAASNVNISDCFVWDKAAAISFIGPGYFPADCSFYSVSGCVGQSLVYSQARMSGFWLQSFSFSNFIRNSMLGVNR